jgi:hypothetical protein
VYGAGTLGSKIFNPDIAVIGDSLAAAGRNTVNPTVSEFLIYTSGIYPEEGS